MTSLLLEVNALLALSLPTHHRHAAARVWFDAFATMRTLSGHRFLVDDTCLAEPVVDSSSMVGTCQVTDFRLLNLAATPGFALATFDAGLRRSVANADRRDVEVLDGW